MPGQLNDVVVVGAGAAGLGAAEGLRARGYAGAITLIGDEAGAPYDRPPLSKQVLAGEWDEDRIALRPADQLAALDLDYRSGRKAVSLAPDHCTVRLDDGSELVAGTLVIATGVRPRRLETNGLSGIHTVRSLADVRGLRAGLGAHARVAIVGAGILGSEIASVLATAGHAVTLIGRDAFPLARNFAPDIGQRIGDLHRAAGVRLVMNSSAAGFESRAGSVAGVRLSSGDVVDCEVAVVAIGSVPNTEWLEGSGLDVEDGVICDASGLAADDVYAIGDVARWFVSSRGSHRRIEHRTNATEQAETVAAAMLGEHRETAAVPYFWSDHYAVKIQAYGDVTGTDTTIQLTGAADDDRWVIGYLFDGVVVGTLGWNAPRDIHRSRAVIGTRSGSLAPPSPRPRT